MNNRQYFILIMAAVISAAMMLYAPYIIVTTGSDLGYHFIFQKNFVVSLGEINMGRLLLQLVALWAVAIALVLGLRKS